MKSYIRESVRQLCAYVPGEQPADRTVIKLNTNENPYPPSPQVAEALSGMEPEDLRRYPDPLCRLLREKIADIHNCTPENVFIGNGSDEILSLCVNAFVENDGITACFEPSYSLYPVLAAIRGVPGVPVELDDTFLWRMPDVPRASLFFLANPNAPTGVLYPKRDVESFCEQFGGVALIDEAYADFASDNCMDIALKLKNALVAKTMSKSLSLAGIRLGYAVGHKSLVEALFKIKDSYNVNAVTQKLALAALADPGYYEGIVLKIKNTRKRLSEELKNMNFFVVPSEANFVWARPSGKNAKEIFESLRKRNIYVRYFPGRLTGDYLRITVGTDEQINELLKVLPHIPGEK